MSHDFARFMSSNVPYSKETLVSFHWSKKEGGKLHLEIQAQLATAPTSLA